MEEYIYIILAVILLVFVIWGCTIRLEIYIFNISEKNKIGTYQMAKINEKDIVILDTRTGQYWKKPIVENSSVKTTTKEPSRYA